MFHIEGAVADRSAITELAAVSRSPLREPPKLWREVRASFPASVFVVSAWFGVSLRQGVPDARAAQLAWAVAAVPALPLGLLASLVAFFVGLVCPGWRAGVMDGTPTSAQQREGEPVRRSPIEATVTVLAWRSIAALVAPLSHLVTFGLLMGGPSS